MCALLAGPGLDGTTHSKLMDRFLDMLFRPRARDALIDLDIPQLKTKRIFRAFKHAAVSLPALMMIPMLQFYNGHPLRDSVLRYRMEPLKFLGLIITHSEQHLLAALQPGMPCAPVTAELQKEPDMRHSNVCF